MSFKVDGKIGPYLILGQIGQGGMGTVFKAYHPALDRYVALKVLHPAFQEDQTFTARFQREARVVARLEHTNIVPIYDYAEDEKLPYLVMKFIEGSTLKNRLTQGSLDSNEIIQVVNSVGSALAYAHQQGVLHRDIKPSNILIGRDGVIYLADFGLARLVQAEVSTLSAESIMGTPHYISPEQATGRDNLTERADIYSFGVMLYEIVVGQIPFNANTPFSIIHDHIYSPLPLPRTLNPDISEQVEHVLLTALAKDPADRFENVAQMVSAFKNAWLNTNNPVQDSLLATPKSFPIITADKDLSVVKKSTTQKKRRNGWLYVLAGIVILISVAFSLIPNLRSNLISVLRSTNTLTASIEFTLTGQVTNNEMTHAPQSSPVSQETNTTAPNPTAQSTQPVQNILTLPPVVEPIQTVVNQVIDTPVVLPSLLP